ncbi:hypothetical protein ARSEF4850_004408 [Beauveria asiatica]
MRLPPRLGLISVLLSAGVFADNILNACSALSDSLGDRVAYPNSTTYTTCMSYWSARQSTQRPACLVTPATADEVALVLTTLIRASAPFTVRAGGHTAHANGSNTDDGVTVDLALLRTRQKRQSPRRPRPSSRRASRTIPTPMRTLSTRPQERVVQPGQG